MISSKFSEKDVRRCYDLLQHDPESGLTQLKAMSAGDVIGIGLFTNEDDFVAECERYNTLGDLYVGVNPRSLGLLDEFGGLRNRMRSVFIDVTSSSSIQSITGFAIPADVDLTDEAREYRKDVSILHDGEQFFALGEPLEAAAADKVTRWAVGDVGEWKLSLDQHVRVPGTFVESGGLLHPRAGFKSYRPYQLPEVTKAISSMSDPA